MSRSVRLLAVFLGRRASVVSLPHSSGEGEGAEVAAGFELITHGLR